MTAADQTVRNGVQGQGLWETPAEDSFVLALDRSVRAMLCAPRVDPAVSCTDRPHL
jgi:hypothetical protein